MFLNKEFSIVNSPGGEVIILPENLKQILIFYAKCPKSASNIVENLPAIKTFYSSQNCCQN